MRLLLQTEAWDKLVGNAMESLKFKDFSRNNSRNLQARGQTQPTHSGGSDAQFTTEQMKQLHRLLNQFQNPTPYSPITYQGNFATVLDVSPLYFPQIFLVFVNEKLKLLMIFFDFCNKHVFHSQTI